MTPAERLVYQRHRRLVNGNADTKKYEKTPSGFLMRLYRNMKSRTSGIQAAKYHLYRGKEILPKEDFYEWASNNEAFLKLYAEYCASGYEQKLAPSVDRVDSARGYSIDNMEWVTHSENSRRGAANRWLHIV